MSNTSGSEVGSVYLKLTLENDVGQQVAQATQQTANQVGSSMGSMFKKAFSVAAIAAIATKLKSMMDEFKEYYKIQEQAEVKLDTIMKQRMNSTDDQVQAIKDEAAAIQQLGVVGDEVLISGSQQLATFMKNSDNLKTLMPAMGNLLAQQKGMNATAEDAVSLANLMGKAIQGNVGALTRVGITFDETQEKLLKYGTEQQKAATLAQVITDNVGNMNETLAQTDSGKVAQLNNRLNDVKEEFGQMGQRLEAKVLPFAEKFLTIIEGVAEQLDPMMDSLETWLSAIGVLDWEDVSKTINKGQSSSEKVASLQAQREDIVASIDKIKEEMEKSDAKEKNEKTNKKEDDGPKAASFDKFNILSFKSATEDLKDAAESLEETTELTGNKTDYNSQLNELKKQLENIDKSIAAAQKEAKNDTDDNTYHPQDKNQDGTVDWNEMTNTQKIGNALFEAGKGIWGDFTTSLEHIGAIINWDEDKMKETSKRLNEGFLMTTLNGAFGSDTPASYADASSNYTQLFKNTKTTPSSVTKQPDLVIAEASKTAGEGSTAADKLSAINDKLGIISSNSNTNIDVSVTLDGDELSNKVVKKINTKTRQTGKSPLAR